MIDRIGEFIVNKLYHHDIRELPPLIPEQSIDVIITSPPYKQSEGFSTDIIRCLGDLARKVLKHDGLLFLNFGDLAELPGRPFIVHGIIKDYLHFVQDIIWVKGPDNAHPLYHGHFAPSNSKKFLTRRHEHIFLFAKDIQDITLDKLSIGIPYTDKTNINRRGHTRDIRDAGDVWYVDYKTIQSRAERLHNYCFPPKLIEKCLLLAGAGQRSLTVLDPFAGSGMVVHVANNLGCAGIGFDMDVERVQRGNIFLGVVENT